MLELAKGTRYEPKKVHEKYREMARLHVLGLNNKEIAETLNVSHVTVGYAINYPAAQEVIKHLRDLRDHNTAEVTRRIQGMVPKVLDTFNEMLDEETTPASVKATLGKDLLDRAGFGAVKKVQTHNTELILTAEDMKKIHARAAEIVDIKPASTLPVISIEG